MNKLEELWKESPEATVDDLLRGAVNTDEVAQVALRYQDRTEIIQYSPAFLVQAKSHQFLHHHSGAICLTSWL